jgi:hypothetical protein
LEDSFTLADPEAFAGCVRRLATQLTLSTSSAEQLVRSAEKKQAAAALRQAGFAIVWLNPGTKNPYREGFPTRSEELGQYRPGNNLGIVTGWPSGDLVCVDLDSPAALDGADEFLPPTGMAAGRPGRPRSHRWYRVKNLPPDLLSDCPSAAADPRTGGGRGGPRGRHFKADRKEILSIKATGGQAVVPPSLWRSEDRTRQEQRVWYDADGKPCDRPGAPAEVDARQLYNAAQRLAEACGWTAKKAATPRAPVPDPTSPPPELEERVRRCRAYVHKTPPAVSGEGGHDRTFGVAGVIAVGFDLPEDEAWPLLCEYNQRCDPPWSEAELRHKLEDALANEGKDPSYPRGWKLQGSAAEAPARPATTPTAWPGRSWPGAPGGTGGRRSGSTTGSATRPCPTTPPRNG